MRFASILSTTFLFTSLVAQAQLFDQTLSVDPSAGSVAGASTVSGAACAEPQMGDSTDKWYAWARCERRRTVKNFSAGTILQYAVAGNAHCKKHAQAFAFDANAAGDLLVKTHGNLANTLAVQCYTDSHKVGGQDVYSLASFLVQIGPECLDEGLITFFNDQNHRNNLGAEDYLGRMRTACAQHMGIVRKFDAMGRPAGIALDHKDFANTDSFLGELHAHNLNDLFSAVSRENARNPQTGTQEDNRRAEPSHCSFGPNCGNSHVSEESEGSAAQVETHDGRSLATEKPIGARVRYEIKPYSHHE